MGRIRSLGPILSQVRSPLARAPGETEAERSRRRDAATPWRDWYKTARWQRLRLRVLNRDNWTCRQTGVLLTGKDPAPNSPIADHIVPHNGDPDLFWDIDNLQAVSKAWHDGPKQSRERTGQA